jgi:hypothetical protein
MRDLIRKILLEYLNPELLLEGKATVVVPQKINIEIDNYLDKLNGFGRGLHGFFYDRNLKVKRRNFIVEDTIHFRQRLFRLSEPEYQPNGDLYDPRIVNPSTLEGLKLLKNNINYISEMLRDGIIKPNNTYINFYTRESEPYSMMVFFSKSISSPKIINIRLITQIKGVKFSNKNTSLKSTLSIELPLTDESVVGGYMSQIIERIKKKLGLII